MTPGGRGYTDSDVVDSDANCRKLLTRRRRLIVGLKNLIDHLRCATSCEISELICKFSEIEVEYGDFKRAVGVIMDSELVTELLDGMADQYEKCHCLLEEVNRKLFNDPREENVEDVVSSDRVSHFDYYSRPTTSSKISTASRRIEFKRKRLELKARHDLELAKAKAEAAQAKVEAEAAQAKAEAEARFLIEQANLEAEEELASLCGPASSITNSRRDRHNDTTKRVNVNVKQNSYPLNPCAELVENIAGLSGRVPELQGSSRLRLTVPDNKVKALNRGGRIGETLNPYVKPFLSAPYHTVVTCDERRLSETFYRHKSREVRSSGLPGAVSSTGLAPLNVRAGATFTAPGNDESIFKAYLDRQG